MSHEDEPTRVFRRSSSPSKDSEQTKHVSTSNYTPQYDEDMTRIMNDGNGYTPSYDNDNTRIMAKSDGENDKTRAASNDDGKTKLAGRPTRSDSVTTEQGKGMFDPVTGWVVIVDGPGKGNSHRLGYNQNHIGRNPNNRIGLAYGDEEISREGHCSITFDPKGKKFYLSQGSSGSNLTYLEGEGMPVLAPAMLTGGEIIIIGKTKLKFIPLCGEDFYWESLEC